jgi:outer membrane protein OmpA-like peptidoglycan-associated protein
VQPILIPGLGAAIDVWVAARFDPEISVLPGSNDFSSSFNAKYMLPDRKATANLTIWASLIYPTHTWKPTGQHSVMYQQNITGTFMHVRLADGKLHFADPGPVVLNPGQPHGPYGDTSETSLFRYVEGRAQLVSANDSDVSIVKIRLVLGTQDVYVKSWSDTENSGQRNTTFNDGGLEGGSNGESLKDIAKDLLKSLVPKVEILGKTSSNTRGGQLTPGQLWAAPEWTLALVMPGRKPSPGPFGLPEPFTFYFDTGKSNADGYRSPLTSMQDQVKGLREYMKAIDQSYGLENIESARVVGHASGLGDNGPNGSRPNINLSLARAQYVAKLLFDLYHVEIPRNKITPEGSPLNSNGKDNKPQDRRAELFIKIKGSARR